MSMRENGRYGQVGLDRLIRIKWLERSASLVLAGNSAKDIKSILQEDLSASFPTSNKLVRGSIDKTITILLKVWLTAPVELESLRLRGLDLLARVSRSNSVAVHWGMIMAVYPFWAGVGIQVGRLLRLQGSVVAAQVQRRVREQYGERETVSRRARYVLRSYLDWGVLQETGEKGIYSAGQSLAIEDSHLVEWMVETSLHARVDGRAPMKDLLDSPSLFPFRFRPIHARNMLIASSTINVLRHGLDDELVMLLKEPA